MKLTTRGRYAVTAMLDLALHQDDGPVALGDIATRQDISLSYLEQLFSRLRRNGVVVSTRGPGGGYRLNGEAGDISIARIVDAVDEPVEYTRCGGSRDCQNHERCLTHDLWEELNQHMRSLLEDITLETLCARPGIREVAARQDREVGIQWMEGPVPAEGH
ncbi:MAG: Rrf2 family transcriptional regulator [Halofilum sp. (in: g-proteobacteria)]|nr:Rrf2 family transcriptional regulator [Halofilum sp. (in: g-proteobacteria)]